MPGESTSLSYCTTVPLASVAVFFTASTEVTRSWTMRTPCLLLRPV